MADLHTKSFGDKTLGTWECLRVLFEDYSQKERGRDVRAAVSGRIDAIKGSAKTEGHFLSFKVSPTVYRRAVFQVREQLRLYWRLRINRR